MLITGRDGGIWARSLFVKIILLLLFVLACTFTAKLVNEAAATPFIDERFHLKQCQTYCAGKWSHWDPKITTPPGLYILGYAYSWIAGKIIRVPNACGSTGVLRSLNLAGGLVAMPLVLRQFKRYCLDQFWTANIVAQPLLFTYYFLFYTDIWLAILVGASLACAFSAADKRGITVIGAAFAFASLWFRQTNAVWLVFAAIVAVERRAGTMRDNPSFIDRVLRCAKTAITNWIMLVPYCIVLGICLVFLKINGGITLGDKDNHAMSLHLVQVFYCATFAAVFTWPVWISKRTFTDYAKFWLGPYGLNILFNACACYGILVVAKKFTLAHPFLLADNRHYTFYIYRRILSRPHSHLFLVPIYHFSTWVVFDALKRARRLALGPLSMIAFAVASAATLAPSPLFEPRYYIVPILLLRIFIHPRNSSRHVLEYVWLNGINAATTLIFLKREFAWASEPGAIQRIIW